MLKIEITEPHTMPRQVLIDTATFLMKMAGIELLPKSPQPLLEPERVPMPPLVAPPVIEPEHVPMPPPVSPAEDPKRINPFAKEPAPTIVASKVANVEVDCNGLPWDARIHSRTKSKTADGAWKLQRGVSMTVVGEVTKELESVMAIPAPVGTRSATLLIPSVPLPPITQPSADPIEPPKETFTTLMNKITELVTAGKLKQAMVVQACQSAGIPSLPLAATRPDLIPQIMANIDLLIS
jgi:hypothetical protein